MDTHTKHIPVILKKNGSNMINFQKQKFLNTIGFVPYTKFII